jgi:hypothetical protein
MENVMKELAKKWVAVKHKITRDGYYLITPLDYFLEKGSIPDSKSGLKLEGLEEVSDHEVTAKPGYNTETQLALCGIEILTDPIWYFDPRHHRFDPTRH